LTAAEPHVLKLLIYTESNRNVDKTLFYFWQ